MLETPTLEEPATTVNGTLPKNVTGTNDAGKSNDVGLMPILEKIRRRMSAVPEAQRAALPTDDAAEHDHYLYGTPKKNEKRGEA